MKDGRTHLAHKAEHAVDLETGAIVAVTVQGADEGDTTSMIETAIAAAEQVEDAHAHVDGPLPLDQPVAERSSWTFPRITSGRGGVDEQRANERLDPTPRAVTKVWAEDDFTRAPPTGIYRSQGNALLSQYSN